MNDLSFFLPIKLMIKWVYAGLHLAEASSRKWKGQIVLSKRGRSPAALPLPCDHESGDE
ncbi:hypothetical protein MEZE111188_13525 [Mesobacillus zeae]